MSNQSARESANNCHVLLVSTSEYVFGAEKSLAALTRAVQAEGCRFTLVSPPGDTQRFFERLGISVETLPLHRFTRRRAVGYQVQQMMRWFLGNWRLYRLCRRLRPDLVHANGIQAMLYVILSACLLHRPVIWHVRDLTFPRLLTSFCARLASVMIVPTVAAAQNLSIWRNKVRMIPNPVEIPGEPPGESEAPEGTEAAALGAKGSGEFKIGLVGQVIFRKGHDLLLDALPMILDHVPHARIIFVGSDPFDPHSAYVQTLERKMADLGARRDHVTWTDYTPRIEMIYPHLDVLVVPSRSEALGRVALEAMAQGCPVIAARTGGLAEIIRDRINGLLFTPEDSAALGRCVIELAGNHSLRNLLARGGFKTAQDCREQIPLIAHEMLTIYEHLAFTPSGKKSQSYSQEKVHLPYEHS